MKNLLYPRYRTIVLLDLLILIALPFTLQNFSGVHPVSIIIYLVSAYTLTATCLNLPAMIKRAKELVTGDELAAVRRFNVFMHKYKYTGMLLDSKEFRAEISLYAGLVINMLYAVMKGVSGWYYNSLWLISAGFYYLVFAVIRAMLAKNIRISHSRNDGIHNWRTYRRCGAMLFVMNLAMSGMAAQMIRQNAANQYSKTLVILSAAYTFYILISAIYNAVKFRKAQNPIYSAIKDLTLAGAVMSMYLLQTSMLATFENQKDNPHFRSTMNTVTGSFVTAFMLFISIFMIKRGTAKINELTESEERE